MRKRASRSDASARSSTRSTGCDAALGGDLVDEALFEPGLGSGTYEITIVRQSGDQPLVRAALAEGGAERGVGVDALLASRVGLPRPA